jgi:hypothetical protein
MKLYSRVPQEQMGTVAEFVSINSDLVAKKIVLSKKQPVTINWTYSNTSLGECWH